MKLNLTQILIGLGMLLITFNIIQYKQVQSLKKDNLVLNNNVKSYATGLVKWRDEYQRSHAKLTEMKLTLAEVYASKDSLTILAVKVIKEGKIKGKTINKLGVIVSTLEAQLNVKPTDPVVIQADTSIKCVTLTDSSFLVNEICYNDSGPMTSLIYGINTQSLIFTHDKVTIAPRRKFFLRRWFQKKQIICNIEIINDNPYIVTQDSKFIELIK
jgi:hypothetical protein